MLTLPLPQALTFDDVLLVPGYSETHPNSIDLSTRLTKGIKLNIPLISAAMDTVTESRLAIAIARMGGVGVIHKNLSIEEQCLEIKKVKTQETPSTSKEVEHHSSNFDQRGRLLVGAALGVNPELMERAEALVSHEVDFFCLDSSHGHSLGVIQSIKDLKKRFPSVPLLAGNVATYEGAKALIEAGADCIKIGIGPGSICTTRIVTGAGMPQLTAIAEASRACREKQIPCIADGGIKCSGDISKAIAAGADSVMLGGLFAGTEESPGDTITFEGRTYKSYRGMGSLAAMKAGSKDRYFQENAELNKLVPEGIEGQVPFKGKLEDVVIQLVGGLRAGMGLSGSSNVQDFIMHSQFVQITNAGLKESHAHDVIMAKESPNYGNN
ncbi:MAG: IMP dehydrogenase [Holophagaceae bacterium]